MPSGEPAKVAHDWPCYRGPGGGFADPSKVPLLDDFSKAKLVWVSEHADLGWAKTGSGGKTARYPKSLHPSGGASLIVAGGKVIVSYFVPKNSVVADDVVLALDAANGKTVWKKVFDGKGVSSGSYKGPQYGATPAAADGKVFVVGSSCRVYALDLATGDTAWETDLGEPHRAIADVQAKAPVTDDRYDGLGFAVLNQWWNSRKLPQPPVEPVMAFGGVVMYPIGGKLYGLDAATGKSAWTLPLGVAPCPVELNGKPYALLATGGGLYLIEPKSGKQVWEEKSAGGPMLVAGDGRAFVGGKPRGGGELTKGVQFLLSAYSLSETGATFLWQSERAPITKGGELAYREGVVYLGVKDGGKGTTDRQRSILALDAKDGSVLSAFEDSTLFKGEFHLWGDRLVLVGDNGHESLGSSCTYWPMTPGSRDLKKSGQAYTPRKTAGYMGVCGEGLTMRDAFADGYQFTRAVNTEKAKGVIMCWDIGDRAGKR